MPATATATHPTGLGITFTESDHSYIDGNGQHYTSGTSVLKLVKPTFDPDGSIAQRCADREGVTVQEMQSKWKAKGVEACRLGTRSHEYAEDLFLCRTPRHTPEDELEDSRFKAILKMGRYIQDTYTFMAVEQIVFSPALAISGTVDLLVMCPSSRVVWILDWKTNEKINRTNEYGGKMLGELSELDDCSFNHYSLQLGLYRNIIMREEYLAANGLADYSVRSALLHVKPSQVEWLETPPLDLAVSNMIIRHLTNVPF